MYKSTGRDVISVRDLLGTLVCLSIRFSRRLVFPAMPVVDYNNNVIVALSIRLYLSQVPTSNHALGREVLVTRRRNSTEETETAT